jgi:hypothetical protein
MSVQQLAQVMLSEITASAEEAGVDLKSIRVVSAYAAERAAVLSALIGHPGYEEAVRAERDNVALRLGIATAAQAHAAEQRMLGVLRTVLSLGARILVA